MSLLWIAVGGAAARIAQGVIKIAGPCDMAGISPVRVTHATLPERKSEELAGQPSGPAHGHVYGWPSKEICGAQPILSDRFHQQFLVGPHALMLSGRKGEA
ncbi:MAG: hypothetical protein A2Y76_06725 [Planctomycetes bacterium RBG_13_60_9]|nr:MAG: hypothetical protein A2Y76_06725 [Planctomycetes bacterium RBG_13_60_9]